MQSGQLVADRFVVEAPVGAGGMGTVYRARDRASGEAVAIKLVRQRHPEDAERFQRESEVLATLAHPHIVRYVAHGKTDDGALFLVMEWVDGVTLYDRLVQQGLTVADTVAMARRVADGLAAVHARGLVHRDVKPSNLIFRDGDLTRTTLIDFGLARRFEPGASGGSLTETGVIVGTPSYMAPEQVRGERQLEPRVDVFALGCVLYECLTGRLAFEGKRFLALRAKILLWNPPRACTLAPDVPMELDDLVASMLAKDPAHRPRDGAELARLLAAVPEVKSGVARPRVRIELPTIGPGSQEGEICAIVVATTIEAADSSLELADTDAGGLRYGLHELLGRIGPHIDVLADGSIVLTIGPGEPRELARRAAACAVLIREEYPERIIAVATGTERDRLVDDAVHGLAKDAMAMVFSGIGSPRVPERAIRVDAATAGLVEAEYEIVRVKGVCYLRSRRA